MDAVPLNTCLANTVHVMSCHGNNSHGKIGIVIACSVLLHLAALFLIPGLTAPAPAAKPLMITLQPLTVPGQTEEKISAAPAATPAIDQMQPVKATKPVIAQKTGKQERPYKPRLEVSGGVSTTEAVKNDSGANTAVSAVHATAQAPKTVRVNASTPDLRYSFYLEAWQQKVERVGRMMYPGNESGSLRLVVSVNADGSLKQCAVLTSSHSEKLDNQACRIVEAAAPFSPLPPDIKREADVLEIVRGWRFDNNNNG